MPLKEMCLMAIMCIGSVGFMNFSLQFNSVGFCANTRTRTHKTRLIVCEQPAPLCCTPLMLRRRVLLCSSLSLCIDQVTKLLCIPCMVLIESAFYGKTYSRRLKLTLGLVLIGVAIATVTDMEVSVVGSVFGALAVVFTTQFQIWMGEKQKAHGLNPMQINHSQSPPAFLFCACLALFFECQGTEPASNVLLHSFARTEVVYILLSCVLALSVNLCTYGLIGKTSPVTFQVVGHAKTCLILLGGFLLFPLPATHMLLKNILGIAVALLGVVVYGDVKVKAEQNPKGRDLYDLACPNCVLTAMDANDSNAPIAPVQYAPVALEMTEGNSKV